MSIELKDRIVENVLVSEFTKACVDHKDACTPFVDAAAQGNMHRCKDKLWITLWQTLCMNCEIHRIFDRRKPVNFMLIIFWRKTDRISNEMVWFCDGIQHYMECTVYNHKSYPQVSAGEEKRIHNFHRLSTVIHKGSAQNRPKSVAKCSGKMAKRE